MFERAFFDSALPEQIRALAADNPAQTPVLHLHVSGGTVYDVCHLIALAESWLSLAFFREPDTCDDVEVAFIPYNQIIRVTVSLPDAGERPIGFDTQPRPLPMPPAP